MTNSKDRRVAVTSPSFAKSPELMAELGKLGVNVVANTKGAKLETESLIKFLVDSQAAIAIVGREPITSDVLSACPKLKFIAKYGVGLDNIDQEALTAHGVGLGWTAGVNKRSVAELVLAFALGHCRNVIPSMVAMRQGRWEKNGGRELSSLTVGIVGFGCTGSEVAKLLKGFGCKLLYVDVVDKSAAARESGAHLVTYKKLLKEADVVTFHVPETDGTRGMLGSIQMATMRRDALVINASRGAVVDFDAACHAVETGALSGFAADVFDIEPCDLSRRDHPHLYFTPHIGGNSVEAVMGMGRAAIEWVKSRLN